MIYSKLLKILNGNICLSKNNEFQVIDLFLFEVIEFGIVVGEIY